MFLIEGEQPREGFRRINTAETRLFEEKKDRFWPLDPNSLRMCLNDLGFGVVCWVDIRQLSRGETEGCLCKTIGVNKKTRITGSPW